VNILVQTLKDGSVRLLETPSPQLAPGCVRVKTLYSAISPGTEGSKIVTGRKSLIGKARAKPDQVKQVLGMVSQIGLRPTIRKVRDKLEGAEPLGYSLAGEVIEVAEGVDKVQPGNLVACAGGGYANHADEVVVPVNLVAKVPANVPADSAAMTTLAAIALQGIRLAEPTLGEHAMVIGLGPIGLMACQLLKANGCRVFGTDIDPAAVERARQPRLADQIAHLGQDPVEKMAAEFSRGGGMDLVLICAATASSEPAALAGRVCRQRGRVVVVGAVGMDLPRPDYYEKELRFGVSCSYGPGRYDPLYEESGLDYPYGFVRWTEGRNMEAVLDMMAAGAFDPLPLVTHRFPFAEAPLAYEMIASHSETFCGILVEYPTTRRAPVSAVALGTSRKSEGKIGVGFIGAGNFAQTFLLPTFREHKATTLGPIYTRTGLTAADVGKRHGFSEAVASPEAVVTHPDTDAVVIATRHDQHGPLTIAALEAGKHVFVEKPLCLRYEDLVRIANLIPGQQTADQAHLLQVGFNRRFSPAAAQARKHFGTAPGPLTMLYRINAGFIPRNHWTQDPIEGGGRILGEVCHFIDLMQFMCGADPVAVSAMCIDSTNTAAVPEDHVVINLKFADGSVGSIGYFASGAPSMPKEQLEILGAGRSAVIHNFQKITLYGAGKTRHIRCGSKGHKEEVLAFLDGIKRGIAPISLISQLATTLATMRIRDALAHGRIERVDLAELADHDT